MAKPLAERSRPRGLWRLAARLPIWLYRLHLGWLLGHRVLYLTHTGRKSGLKRHVVLEVVRYDPHSSTFLAASGWGKKSDWYQNIQKTPEVSLQSGRTRMKATAVNLTQQEAERELQDYARRHPLAYKELVRVMLGENQGSFQEASRKLAQNTPMVAFVPRDGSRPEKQEQG
jgi:deazaflavin-dependent oxidoreductase (nitroreductase family)